MRCTERGARHREARGVITPHVLVACLGLLLAVQHTSPGRLSAAAASSTPGVLRVCSDPNNLPFSNQQQQGFENAIAVMLASFRHQRLEYTWWRQRRGFIRTTLGAGVCDVIIGVPSTMNAVLPTAPYYRSSYVFVTRRDSGLAIDSVDDPRLKTLTIGVHVMGNDYAVAPPGEALIARGLSSRIRGSASWATTPSQIRRQPSSMP